MPADSQAPFKKILVANRSEIAIRVFRSAHELGIRTVAVYSQEDRFALHRFKADEAYAVGKPGEPIRAYLDIPGIVQLARDVGVDAIHPGYGFLSENAAFARACAAMPASPSSARGPEGSRSTRRQGDRAGHRQEGERPRALGRRQPGVDHRSGEGTRRETRLPHHRQSVDGRRRSRHAGRSHGRQTGRKPSTRPAARPGAAFGVTDVFLEKFVQRAKHIEVQLIGDKHGGLVHLFERDCSIQRATPEGRRTRPRPPTCPLKCGRGSSTRRSLVGKACGIDNASTVEFLYDTDANRFYFIEVNPRIQVEHTVTEQVTGFDIVRSQILIASGQKLDSEFVGLRQSEISTRGFAIQARVTTEDPANGFVPDYGRLSAYRSSGGPGIRLDAGTAFGGAVITPFYDSLLVKVTASGLRFDEAAMRMERCLQEFRVRGVKTNIPFLLNLIEHPKFLAGEVTTRFLDETPELFQFQTRRDRASKLLAYLAEVIVNGHPEIKGAKRTHGQRGDSQPRRQGGGVAPIQRVAATTIPPGESRTSSRGSGPLAIREVGSRCRSRCSSPIPQCGMRTSRFSQRECVRTICSRLPIDTRVRRICSRWRCGVGRHSIPVCGFLKESPWDRLARLRETHPEHPVPDASASSECRRLHELPGQRR